MQRWVGEVIEVADGWITVDFVTTIGGQDDERVAFRVEETLDEMDRESLTGARRAIRVNEQRRAGR